MSLPVLPPSPAACAPHGSAACMQQSAGHFYGQVGHFAGEVLGPVAWLVNGVLGLAFYAVLGALILSAAGVALMFLTGTRSPSRRVREFWHRAITGGDQL